MNARVDQIVALYLSRGETAYSPDRVSHLEHSLQAAAQAVAAGAPDSLVVAALLHDVGHLLEMSGGPAGPHERTAPAFLAPLFPASVAAPIALHVAAKRYLCAVEHGYHAALSAGSQRSLRRQGGPLGAGDVAAFEAKPGWADAVSLRRWDDGAKVVGASVPGLAGYEPLLRSLSLACSGS